MQGQKGYVNGYVVIIFAHYINFRRGGGMRGNVTLASFFGTVGRLNEGETPRKPLIAVCCLPYPSRSASSGNSASQEAWIFTCNSSSPRVLPRLIAITGLPCSTMALHRRNAE
jgi:hypothetical protein